MSSEQTETRERILKSTWRLLEQGGASAVRMSDIAKAAQVSRQAVYLHFANRAELLNATTRYLDQVHNIEDKLRPSRQAKTGRDRLDKWVAVWAGHIPTIYGVAKALMAMQDTDAAARAAWSDRLQAIHEGCEAAVTALANDGDLTPTLTVTEAADLLSALLSVRNWEHLRHECGWSQADYVRRMKATAARALIADHS